jgi:copper chaperone CopZ
VALTVRMDCEGCEMKVRNALTRMKGTTYLSIGLDCTYPRKKK